MTTMTTVAECPLWIAGQAVRTESTEKVLNPFNGEVLYRVSQAGKHELQCALDSASAAFESFRKWPAWQRAQTLRQASTLLTERAELFARTIAVEAGKPIKAARLEVARSSETLTFAAEAAMRLSGEGIPLNASRFGGHRAAFTVREPRGVIAAISPFNFPLNLALHKVAPALAAGNCVILKPAPQTPMTGLLLGQLLSDAGFPEGVMTVLHGDGTLGSALTSAQQVAFVTFTGSAAIGQAIKVNSGLKPIALELGNNSANIVDEHADIRQAAEKLCLASFMYQGQVCVHAQRLFVHAQVYEQFKEHFLTAARALQLGDPLEETTDLGPLINQAAITRLNEWVREAVELGGSLLTGGRASGRFFPPTVFENVPQEAKVVREEVFGPIVVLQKVSDFNDAIQRANASRYGLQVGLFTHNLPNALLAVQEVRAGGVIINDPSTFRVDHMPFGGVKDSGFGKEGVPYAIEEMTNLKTVVLS